MKHLHFITAASIAAFLFTTQAQAELQLFSFQYKTACPQETVQSDPIIIEGLNNSEKTKIQGSGSYILNGQEMGQEEHMVQNGDRISLKQEALPSENAKVSTTLLIGDIYEVFTVVTKKKDTCAANSSTSPQPELFLSENR
jgi:hypothetical protein